MEDSKDFSLYHTIRLEDKKGKVYGDAAFNSNKDNFSSDHIRRCVRALLNHKILKEAFDPLLETRGLRQGMRFSTLHKLCCAKADEALDKIDIEDVQALELRCPQLCSRDAEDILKMINDGHIFRAFNQEERESIKHIILSIDYVIPSIGTFFQDVHLLEMCAASMRHIVTPFYKMTIRETLRRGFTPTIAVHSPQVTVSPAIEAPTDGLDPSFDLAMEQLWIYLVGVFQRMPPPNLGTGGRLLAGYLVKKPDVGVLSRVAKYAQKLGFKTPEIERLSQLAIDGNSEYPANLKVNNQPQLTNFVSQNPNLAAFLITGHVKNSLNRSAAKSPVSYARVLRQRRGRPKHDLYQEDRKYLMIELVRFNFGALNMKSQDISSFQILRSQCLSFFSLSKEMDNSGAYKTPADVNASEADTTCILEQIYSVRSTSFSSKYQEEERRRKESGNYQVSHNNNANDITAPKDQHTSSLGSVSKSQTHNPRSTRHIDKKNFKFIVHQEGQFKTFLQVDTDQEDDVKEVATTILRDHEMSLYYLDCTPLLAEDCWKLPRDDLNNILLLPTTDFVINDELKTAAAAYRKKEQRAQLEEFRRR
ncbi:hypothetical protein M441DRAFT_459700 [Trichoderma asperellum CBS 433.97]|uniref:Uncharacterized protein n=1 Tax=Trichoderma asperellum (strain ATCC 204424 / CBS 433.97 / NBRC 101777) TaxID=1042311 RepID=A0A2T3Z6F8_TRIA4|nr:hypothetical protein M441DRAFT_459700 [Trichoderma asperellum CBS 433.97]PTB40387.1 hypothetical protein M441DRAFT_459700 [Trichoderma asperellum CBS 433.97]